MSLVGEGETGALYRGESCREGDPVQRGDRGQDAVQSGFLYSEV